MEKILLIGRSSRLSLLQIEIVKNKITAAFPEIKVEIITKSSKGDELLNVPLHTVEGSDFFTQDIFDSLKNGEADIAVHSLKDMSSEHFFGKNKFAVVDRDDTRDVAIFNADIEEKIKSGKPITIGTCSPRREEMAAVFLKKALPQLHNDIKIETKSIRGNVETRLRKLNNGEYDTTILATAGLNRLLRSGTDRSLIKELLKNKKLMLLPSIECVPAPCQGAIVAEANPANQKAIEVLKKINSMELMHDCLQEKQSAMQYGVGCLQRFGVTTISYGNKKVVYAAGKDSNGNIFTKWFNLPDIDTTEKKLFSMTDFMSNLFHYEYDDGELQIKEPVVYAANYKAVKQKEVIRQLQSKKVWAAGSKTWFELAKQGIWVEGCADGFGLEFLQTSWQMPLFGISKNDVAVITNNQSAGKWQAKAWNVYAAYRLSEKESPEIKKQIKEADIIFWTSYQQCVQYKNELKEDVLHICPYGETVEQLKAAGINPVVFPNIKAFQQWKQTLIPSPSVA